MPARKRIGTFLRTCIALNIEDPTELLSYLRRNGRLKGDESVVCTPLSGGVSNRTVRVGFSGGGGWVLKQALPKLRVREDWFSDPARVHQEAAALRVTRELAPAGSVPRLVFEDPEHHLLAIEAIAEPHENWKQRLLRGLVERAHIEQFARWLGQVHRRSGEQCPALEPLLGPRTFFETLRLEPYYAFAASRNPALQGFMAQLIADTRAARLCLVHGDYSPKNVLIHQGRLIVLDYEVAHLGDPAFDLGFALTHLLSKAHHLAHCRAGFLEGAGLFWKVYQTASGHWGADPGLEARAVRHTLGCLLARVDGRSPLEYLRPNERDRQRAVVAQLAAEPPSCLLELIASFATLLEAGGRIGISAAQRGGKHGAG